VFAVGTRQKNSPVNAKDDGSDEKSVKYFQDTSGDRNDDVLQRSEALKDSHYSKNSDASYNLS
jgi:hypothetical protein